MSTGPIDWNYNFTNVTALQSPGACVVFKLTTKNCKHFSDLKNKFNESSLSQGKVHL